MTYMKNEIAQRLNEFMKKLGKERKEKIKWLIFLVMLPLPIILCLFIPFAVLGGEYIFCVFLIMFLCIWEVAVLINWIVFCAKQIHLKRLIKFTNDLLGNTNLMSKK